MWFYEKVWVATIFVKIMYDKKILKEMKISYREDIDEKWKLIAQPYKTKVLKKKFQELYINGIEIDQKPIGTCHHGFKKLWFYYILANEEKKVAKLCWPKMTKCWISYKMGPGMMKYGFYSTQMDEKYIKKKILIVKRPRNIVL